MSAPPMTRFILRDAIPIPHNSLAKEIMAEMCAMLNFRRRAAPLSSRYAARRRVHRRGAPTRRTPPIFCGAPRPAAVLSPFPDSMKVLSVRNEGRIKLMPEKQILWFRRNVHATPIHQVWGSNAKFVHSMTVRICPFCDSPNSSIP